MFLPKIFESNLYEQCVSIVSWIQTILEQAYEHWFLVLHHNTVHLFDVFFCNQNMFNSFTLLFLYYIIHHFASLWSTIRAGFCNCICTMSFASFIEAVFDGFFKTCWRSWTWLCVVTWSCCRWCCHLVLIS